MRPKGSKVLRLAEALAVGIVAMETMAKGPKDLLTELNNVAQWFPYYYIFTLLCNWYRILRKSQCSGYFMEGFLKDSLLSHSHLSLCQQPRAFQAALIPYVLWLDP